MERSDEVANIVVRFYEAIALGTSAAFDSVVSADPEAMVQLHLSVMVPDDVALAQTDAWAAATDA